MDETRDFKTQLYEHFARIGKALSSGHRLELLDLLAQGGRTVEVLAREAGMSVANTSQHLQVLREAQLVAVRRDGQYASYRLADEQVFRAWQEVRELGRARLAEIDRTVSDFLADRETLQAVNAHELLRLVREEKVVVLDVRPKEEYQAGHIAGARSVPLAELKVHIKRLPKSREIIAYCRGPYCVLADNAVAFLRSRGYKARRLDSGYPDWKVQGLPVAVS